MDERKIIFQLEEGRSLNISLCFNVWFLSPSYSHLKPWKKPLALGETFKHFESIWSLPVNCTCLNSEGWLWIDSCVVNWGKHWVWGGGWVFVLPLIFFFPSLSLSFLICKWRLRWWEDPQSIAILQFCHPFDPPHSILSGRNWLLGKQQLSFFFFFP